MDDIELRPLSTVERLAPAILTRIVRDAAFNVANCRVPAAPEQINKLFAVVEAIRGHIEGKAAGLLPEPAVGPRDAVVGCAIDSPTVYALAYDSVVRLLMSAESRDVLQDLGNRGKGALRAALDDLDRATHLAHLTLEVRRWH
jgi:hypothetical protein